MKRELFFLNESKYSYAFRKKKGYDLETYLDAKYIAEVPEMDGVYIIVSNDNTKFIYPGGESPIIYIGKADNLRRRLGGHLRNLNNLEKNEKNDIYKQIQHYSRYHYMKRFGAKVYIYQTMRNQNAKNLESYILWRFYEKYRALPVGNGARSFGK